VVAPIVGEEEGIRRGFEVVGCSVVASIVGEEEGIRRGFEVVGCSVVAPIVGDEVGGGKVVAAVGNVEGIREVGT
jgi:hypothetical protein